MFRSDELREVLCFTVFGTPGPQGSKKAMPIYTGSKAKGTRQFSGRVTMQESSAKVKPWRSAVEGAALDMLRQRVAWVPLAGPVVLSVVFTLNRPKSYPKSVVHHLKYPDLSKLVRSTEDAMTTAHVWEDDARVIGYRDTWKIYVGAPGALPVPGATIRVYVPNGLPS